MKTELQEILDILENDWCSPQPYIDLVESFIEKEKQQILDAHKDGSECENHYSDFEPSMHDGESEKYYNETYTKQ